METYYKKSKIGRGNRFFRGLSKRTNHRFLQTRETVPLKFALSAYIDVKIICCWGSQYRYQNMLNLKAYFITGLKNGKQINLDKLETRMIKQQRKRKKR